MSADQSTPPKPKLRWYQYRLRTLFILTFLVAVACSWLAVKMEQARKQKEAVEAILKLGGLVGYDDEENLIDTVPGPLWTHDLLGKDFFYKVTSVWLTDMKLSDDDMKHLDTLKNVSELNLSNSTISNESWQHLESLKELEVLYLTDTNMTGNEMKYLKTLRNLKWLWLAEAHITNNELKNLENLKNLDTLFIVETDDNEEEIQKLKKSMPNLRINIDPINDPR
jgi:hypothetical protein